MKKETTVLMLMVLAICTTGFSMPPAVQDKIAKEKASQEAEARLNQHYEELVNELAYKPDSAAVQALGVAIADTKKLLPTEQKTSPEHASANAALSRFYTEQQEKLRYLSENGNNAVRWLNDVTTKPEGTFAPADIIRFIQKGRQFYTAAIKIDCNATPAFVEPFYALLNHPRISPYAEQGLTA